MAGVFRTWFGSKISTPSRKANRRRRRANLALENLETRCLLSGVPIVVTTLSDAPSHVGTSLRDAIQQANSNPGADTITFKTGLSGTITLACGQLKITDAVSIKGPGSIIIDAHDKSRIFDINICRGTGDVSLSKLTLENGRVCAGYGGGIYADYVGKLTLTNVTIQGCESIAFGRGGEGGGIDVEMGDLVLINSVISGNSATGDCGCGSAGRGGGINICACSTLSIQNSTIRNNHASSQAGGINLEGKATILSSTISGNTCDIGGGGLVSDGGDLTMVNCTIAKNKAQYGGGLYAISYIGQVTIQNCTIAQNSATDGTGGVGNVAGTMTLRNTIIAGNKRGTANDDLANFEGGTINASYCLIQAPGSALSGGTGSHNIIGFAPLLGPLASNGGPTQTMALLPGSKAINAGDPNFAPPPSTDQRGTGFARVSGGRLDIGAFEVQVPPASTSHRGQRP
jgi:hypothetical protein